VSRILLWPVLAGVLVAVVLVVWRGFFFQHALIIGIGVAALVYTGLRTYENLRNLHKH
jgi:hypothetical protein